MDLSGQAAPAMCPQEEEAGGSSPTPPPPPSRDTPPPTAPGDVRSPLTSKGLGPKVSQLVLLGGCLFTACPSPPPSPEVTALWAPRDVPAPHPQAVTPLPSPPGQPRAGAGMEEAPQEGRAMERGRGRLCVTPRGPLGAAVANQGGADRKMGGEVPFLRPGSPAPRAGGTCLPGHRLGCGPQGRTGWAPGRQSPQPLTPGADGPAGSSRELREPTSPRLLPRLTRSPGPACHPPPNVTPLPQLHPRRSLP